MSPPARPEIGLALPGDDAGIRSLLRRESIPGPIRLSYRTEPSYFRSAQLLGETTQTLVARTPDGEIVGVAARSSRTVFFNGSERRLGYLGQLRVDSRFRGQWLVSRGFAELRRLHAEDPLPAYLISIVEGNEEALGVLLHKARPGFPSLRPLAQFRTLAIDLARPRPPLATRLTFAPAAANDLPELVRFLNRCAAEKQCASAWTEASVLRLAAHGLQLHDLRVVRSGSEMVGVAALWDQSAIKQTVVEGYAGPLERLLPLYNLAARALGRVPLPRAGERLRNVYVALLATPAARDDVFPVLLRELYRAARARGFAYLLLGLDACDVRLPIASRYAHILYRSRLFLASWPGGATLDEEPDGRPAHVDIATL